MKKMRSFTASEARQGFSGLLSTVQQEPITITKDNKEVAIMIEANRYHELKRIEDILYGKAAELALQDGFMPREESDSLLNSLKI
jgi:prevent-host-death family protein